MAEADKYRIGVVAFDVTRATDDLVAVCLRRLPKDCESDENGFTTAWFEHDGAEWHRHRLHSDAGSPTELLTVARAVNRYGSHNDPAAFVAELEEHHARRVVWDPRVNRYIEVTELAKKTKAPYGITAKGAVKVSARDDEQARAAIRRKLIDEEEWGALQKWTADKCSVVRREEAPPEVLTYEELFAGPAVEEPGDGKAAD